MKKMIQVFILCIIMMVSFASPYTSVYATDTASNADDISADASDTEDVSESDSDIISSGRFSEDDLNKTYDELVDNYLLNDDYIGIVKNVGIMLGAMENGKSISFSDDLTERRVVISVNSKFYSTLKADFAEKYGEIVFVESVGVAESEALGAAAERLSKGSIKSTVDKDQAETTLTPIVTRTNSNQTQKTLLGNGPVVQIIFGVVLVIVIVAIVVMVKKKK